MTTDFAKKTSLKVAQQLPEFIRSSNDYQTFVTFIQAYYEWMEQYNIGNNKEGVIRGTQNLLNYSDIDFINPGESYNKFIDYYLNEFVPSFPKDALTDKTKLAKIAKELYAKKGTPASYEFLFRALYNSDAEIFLTRDAIFKASDGKWYVSKSLRLSTNDEQWLSTNNLRIIGETSKSIATIERAIAVGSRIEVYISNIQRLFQSGENVTVVDNNNRPLYFKDSEIVPEGTPGSSILNAKILGTISSLSITNNKRGQLYKVNDPVVFYGGLNSSNGIGAEAYISEVTAGSLRSIDVVDGSYGYRPDPNTFIRIVGGGGTGAIANVTTIDPNGEINVSFIPSDYLSNTVRLFRVGNTVSNMAQILVNDYTANATIITGNAVSLSGIQTGNTITIIGANTNLNLNGSYTITVANSQYFFITNTNGTPTGTWTGLANTGITARGVFNNYTFLPANTSSNITSSLANSLTFSAFSTYPIDVVNLNNGGGGYTSLPTISAISLYDTLNPTIKGNLGSLGILGPIEINIPGTGYANGDFIVFNGGGGAGANAYVNVNATGSIISTTYNYQNTTSGIVNYPRGGLGYDVDNLPTLTINSSGGSGANLSINYILGEGAEFSATPDERGIGAITSFAITNFGEDYISAPNVSLRVRDLIVKNVNTSDIIKTGDIIYQGSSSETSVFKANVASINLLEADENPANSKYTLRVYNYTSSTKENLQLKSTDRIIGANLYYDLVTSYNQNDFVKGIKTYGNGAAQATARFLNGLIIGEGQYLNDDGFPSSFQIIENEDYNNYTYQLTVQKSFSAYKEVLFNLLHPSGTKVIPFNSLKANSNFNMDTEVHYSNTHTLGFYTGDPGSSAEMYGTFENPSNNIIKFQNLVGANLETIIVPDTIITIEQPNGPNVYSEILSVSSTSNTAVLKDNVFLAFANVAVANVSTSCTQINIVSITDQYDLINGGDYSNTQNKLLDIAFVGDTIRIVSGANSFNGQITNVNYTNKVITVNTAIGFTSNNANVSIRRNISTTDVLIYNYLGTRYLSEITTQDGNTITTQDGRRILIG